MAVSLANLSREVLGQILGLSLSSGTLTLWLTGNRVIQRQIALSATEISLYNPRRFTLSRFPKFLENLQSLQELTLDRSGGSLLYYRDAWMIIEKLPSGLRKLSLRFRNSFETVDPIAVHTRRIARLGKSNSARISPKISRWTLKTAFPSLEALEIRGKFTWTSDDFASLPASLTSLTTSIPREPSTVRDFPRQLLHLKYHSDRDMNLNPELLRLLPPNLTSLELPGCLAFMSILPATYPPEILQGLPSSLTNFTVRIAFIPGDSHDRSNITEHLPRGITSLNWCDVAPLSTSLSKLPLKELSANLYSSAIPTLPSTLTKITGWLRMNSSDLQWPPSLTEANFSGHLGNDTDAVLTSLPPSLRIFSLFGDQFLTNDQVSRLPRSLTSLRVRCHPGDGLLDLPPLLTSLSIEIPHPDSNENIVPFPLTDLPRTLTSLQFPGVIKASHLKLLSSHLETLNVDDIIFDGEFDVSSQEEIRKMHHNFEVGEAAGIQEQFDWRSLSSVSVATMLPRTLKTLSVVGTLMNEHAPNDWKMIPPQLTSISALPAGGINAALMLEMPWKSMTRLNLTIDAPENEHILALPRTLDSESVIWLKGPKKLTPACVLHFYSDIAIRNSNEISEAQERLKELRQDHSLDEDPTRFIELMTLRKMP